MNTVDYAEHPRLHPNRQTVAPHLNCDGRAPPSSLYGLRPPTVASNLGHPAAEFAANVAHYRMGRGTTAIFTDGGDILLDRSRGYSQLLEDLAHDGTHSFDIAPGGRFAGLVPSQLTGENLFVMEYRAYRAQALVNANSPFRSKLYTRDYVHAEYPGSVAPQ